MDPLTGKEASARVQGLISPKYQVHAYAVDLTLRRVYALDPLAQVDFGGSEYRPAGKLPIAALRHNPEDKYEWWDLDRGSYMVEFNEKLDLAENEMGVVEPEDRLLRGGAWHVPVHVRGKVDPVETILAVGALRIKIKQNARISRLRVFRFDTAGAPATPAATTPKTGRNRKRKR
jgi:deoxycytidine triphosphate deaminase